MESDYFFFNPDELLPLGETKREEYISAEPFPHIVLDDLLPTKVAERLHDEFPTPDYEGFARPDNEYQKRKLGKVQDSYFRGVSPFIRQVLAEFNGMAFLDFLERLTGMEAIIPDPHFKGGALHQVLPGGSLAIHADFNKDKRRGLDRRINVLLYLNKGWQEEYGGGVELWDQSMDRCVVRATPVLNRCVVFNTTSTSYHGHPDPLACPEGMTRKSLAFYYYTNGRDVQMDQEAHSTLWQARPGEVFDRASVAK